MRTILCISVLLFQPLPGFSQDVSGRLEDHLVEYIQDVEVRLPAVLAIPGCSGVSLDSPSTDQGGGSPTDPYFRRHYPKVAAVLRDEGYAVFLLDYHAAESVVSACLGEVTPTRIAEYVVTALRRVAADPRVDREDIFIIGWSLGGAGLLRAVERLASERTPVSAAIAIYPGCAGMAPWSHDLPVHLFLGDADDIAPAETCRSFVESLDSSLPVAVTSYPDARHGFDLDEAPPMISTERGTTVGYNRTAAESAWGNIREILGRREGGADHSIR